jgi:hypothetical protein
MDSTKFVFRYDPPGGPSRHFEISHEILTDRYATVGSTPRNDVFVSGADLPPQFLILRFHSNLQELHFSVPENGPEIQFEDRKIRMGILHPGQFLKTGSGALFRYLGQRHPLPGSEPGTRSGAGDGLEEGGIIDGRYRIISVLGKGGMGIVFLCWDNEDYKPVAIKMITIEWVENQAMISEIADRFDREIAALSRIHHPAIVRILGAGRHGERKYPYYVMDYIQGQESVVYLNQFSGADRWDRAANLMEQLLQALAHVHDAGLIHRDLKPGNLLVESSLSGIQLKILDFGLSKGFRETAPGVERDEKSDSLTAPSMQIGTSAYMSPEQCLNSKKVTASADIYSCGIICCEFFAGIYPYRRPDEETSYEELHLRAEVRDSALREAMPVYVIDFVKLCLKKNAEERPVNGREALDLWRSLRQGEGGNGPKSRLSGRVLFGHDPDAVPPGPAFWKLGVAGVVFVCLLGWLMNLLVR